jgi:hypothetical protein
VIHLDVIRARSASTAAWRNTLIARYPNDSVRNARARDLLQGLAVMPNDCVSLPIQERLSQFHGPQFARAVNESCKVVGFRFMPLTLEDLAADIISRLETSNAEATR